MPKYLVLVLENPIRKFIETSENIKALSETYSFRIINDVQCHGFYSFLRKGHGKIIGVRFNPFDELLFAREKGLEKIDSEYYVFFGKEREFNQSESNDTAFFEFYLAELLNETCLIFDVSFVEEGSFNK